MARKTASRMDLRREAEAAEAQGTTKKKAKKKATRKKTTRKKTVKAAVRRQLIWGVFSGSLKEEARFPYDQREAAEEKLQQLRNRSTKKMYFIQPIKEPIGDAPAPAEEEAPVLDEVEEIKVIPDVAEIDDSDLDLEVEDVDALEIDDDGEPVEPASEDEK